MKTGTTTCVQCEQEFTEANPCCCDHATLEDGTHEEGYCKACCGPHPSYRNSGVGSYERMDCDQ